MKTTSFEISKKLRDLGIHLDTNFSWIKMDHAENGGTMIWEIHYEDNVNGIEYPNEYHIEAYTLEDILEVLPKHLSSEGYSESLIVEVKYNLIGYEMIWNEGRKENETLATTAARLLIKLLEDKIITIEEVNK